MPLKMTTLGLLKMKAVWNKCCEVIIYIHDFTDKILSRDSNYFVDVVMSPKFGNLSISMKEVITTSVL